MFLWEVFGGSDDGDGMTLIERLREDAIDFLLPLASHGVPFINFDAVINKLKQRNTGIEIDRPLVMKVLDPNEVKLITKIEGEKIYFKIPKPVYSKKNDNEKEKSERHLNKSATDKAIKNLKGK